jgi:hypothetical protein
MPEGLVDALGYGHGRDREHQGQPEHVLVEPIRTLQPEAEPADAREQPPEPGGASST